MKDEILPNYPTQLESRLNLDYKTLPASSSSVVVKGIPFQENSPPSIANTATAESALYGIPFPHQIFNYLLS